MNCFLFSGLNETEISEIIAKLQPPKTVAKGEELYRLGYIGMIVSGSAKVCRMGDTGSAITIRSMNAGEVFGVASVFGEWKQGKSSIIAKTECVCLYASEDELKSIFEQFPAVAVNYISFLSDRIRFLNRRVDAFSAGSAVQKLYEYLVSQSNDGVVTLDFGLAELARRLKMGRSSLYRSLEVLQESGLVTRNKNTYTVK